MKYEIVSAGSSETVEEMVNDMLADGWELVGGVSVARAWDTERNDDYWTYAQAMRKPV